MLVDANVLASRTLRDWILMLQVQASGMFTTCWTEDILAETIHAMRKRNPAVAGSSITQVADTMRQVMGERIDAFEVIAFPDIRDEFDLHVHAAAIAGGVDMLVTLDSDFLELPTGVADELPYEILSPDSFLVLVDDSGPEHVREVLSQQWEYWRRRDPSTDLPQRLRNANCPEFAERVYRHQRA
ncbi:MAG: PIN domain-containing protein [Demequina sp.]